MLTAAGSMVAPRPQPPISETLARRPVPLLASAVLHGLVAAVFLLHWAPAAPDNVPPLEVEMVQDPAEQAGTPPPPATPVPTTPEPAAPERDGAARPPPQQQTPTSAAKPSPPTPAPEINLGNSRLNRAPLSVVSDNIRPPAPDARYRNMPPQYPPDAASIGAEGTVQVLAHITTLGVPSDVVVLRSSGNLSLDASAREAVLLWHFQPARAGRRAVPFDYVLNVKFTLGDR